MKKGFFIFVLFFIIQAPKAWAVGDSTVVAAPPAPKKEHKVHHYLSLNFTFFVKQFLTFSGSGVIVTSSPYVLEYKMLHKNDGFRFGIGGSLKNQKKFLDSSQVVISKQNTVDMRLGYVHQGKIAKHWSYFVGADIVAQVSDTLLRNNTTVDVVTNQSDGFTIGIGPSFGIEFDITNRIGLFTESAIYYTFNQQNLTNTSVNFPELSTSNKILNNNLEFMIPTSLYFFVRF